MVLMMTFYIGIEDIWVIFTTNTISPSPFLVPIILTDPLRGPS